ncbi:protein of unknown function [Luteibacter sp. UNC138MFCol5.1]|nr:protein of unknown function [Luteibacter sp. UNC138MFCol5.1]
MNRPHIWLAALAFSLVSPISVAQCATGVNTGAGNCIPPDADGMPEYQGQGTAVAEPPPVVWANAWGAIVLDAKNSAKGVSSGRASKSDAIRAAMEECKATGAPNCELQVACGDQCAAVVWGDESYGVANEGTLEAASQRAVRACSRTGQGCRVVYSNCSLPKRLQ